MRIRMIRTRLFRVPTNRNVSFLYKADCRYTVKRAWGEAMIADGDAVELEVPPVRRRGRRKDTV
jgi:hypothetical protein